MEQQNQTETQSKIQVGQTVYSLAIGNDARRNSKVRELTEYEVSKVGRKYFYIIREGMYWRPVKFLLKDLSEVSEYCSNHRLFLSIDEYNDWCKRQDLSARIKSAFGRFASITRILTIEDMELILEITDRAQMADAMLKAREGGAE